MGLAHQLFRRECSQFFRRRRSWPFLFVTGAAGKSWLLSRRSCFSLSCWFP